MDCGAAAGVNVVRILLVQDNPDLGTIWCRFLRRHGLEVILATTQAEAAAALARQPFDVLILEPALGAAAAGLPVADLATYHNPGIAILAVTKSSFFADGAVFSLIPNARGVLRTPLRPDDLLAYLEHFGARGHDAARAEAGGKR